MTADSVGHGRSRRSPITEPSGQIPSCCNSLALFGASKADTRRCPDQPVPPTTNRLPVREVMFDQTLHVRRPRPEQPTPCPTGTFVP
jgi:hypothetical protein